MIKVFKNREHAGKILGKVLFDKFNKDQPVIFGIPRGGIEVAYYVAQFFKTSVSAILSRKLPYPGNEEVAFGAIAEDLTVFIRPGIQLDPKVIMNIIEQQMDELEKRLNFFRSGKVLPELEDKTVLLIDDGIATGATILSVLKFLKKKNVSKIFVAVPISGPSAFPQLFELADEVITLVKPEKFISVSQVYEDFTELNDDQLKLLL